ncbi:MAG: AMP-binding protein, partial [Gordonia sp. (in: high G+C Gram-positive bacteria)]
MDSTEDPWSVAADVDHRQLPLTAAQRGMWFAENLSDDYSVTVAQYLEIRDDGRPLDHELFGRCVVETGRILQSPFTRLIEVDGVAHQVIDESVPFTVDLLDLRDEPDPMAAAQEWMRRDHQAPVDLLDVPLAVSALIRVADDRTLWYLRGHHIIIDGYAALTAVTEVCNRYNAAARGTAYTPRPAADVAQIVADDHAYTESSRRAADHEYWAANAGDLPERVTLAQHANTAALNPRNVMAGTRMSAAMCRRIDALSAELATSPAVVLTAAFAAYLARMTGTDDVVLSLPVTGRATARIKRAGGMLSNMLPIRTRETSRLSLRALLDQLRIELTGALRHQRYRFEDIRVDAGLRDANTASFGPIVNMVFFDKPIEIDGARVDYHILTSGILEDLRINFYRPGPAAGIVVDLHGNSELYQQAELDAHLARFLLVADRLIDDVDAVVEDVDLHFPAEADDLRALGVGPSAVPSPDRLLDGFLDHVRATPAAAAVDVAGDRWTYAEFDAARRTLARLLGEAGVRAHDRVVIALDRGADQVCAVYAVLGLGAAYVPIDPQQPADRRRTIEQIVSPALVIDEQFLQDTGFDARAAIGADPATAPVAELAPVSDAAAAYIIFTSGSTGAPKGVQVAHNAIKNRLDWMQADYPLTAADAVLYKTPITFDVSVWELLWPLRTGARMVIAAPGGHRDPEYLFDLIGRRGVTVAHFVPSMLDVYVDVVAADGHTRVLPPAVRRVFTSGEALPRALAATVLAASSVDLVNLYGPTEAA